MVRLAVIILTKDEENNIEDCIKSASFADEIVVKMGATVTQEKKKPEYWDGGEDPVKVILGQ